MNRAFDIIYQVFLKSNFFMSMCAVAFYYAGTMVIDERADARYDIIMSCLFFSTLLIYNISQKSIQLPDLKRLNQRPTMLNYGLLISLSAILVFHAFFLKGKVILFLLHLALLSLLYNLPYLNKSRFLPLRGIPIIKVFIIAYVWACIGAILPELVMGIDHSRYTLQLFAAQFAFIVAITLPFDIRDYYKDKEQLLVTIPGLIGVNWTKVFAVVLLLISVVFQGYFVDHSALLFINIIPLVLILNASSGKKNYYYLLFVDGAIVLFLLMVWLDKEMVYN